MSMRTGMEPGPFRKGTITLFLLLSSSIICLLPIIAQSQPSGSLLSKLPERQNAQAEVRVDVHPKPFTPNGDGYNDTLYVAFPEGGVQSPATFIYSLDGRKTSEAKLLTPGLLYWTGKDLLGRLAPPGAYVYQVKDGNKELETGLIYLAR